MFILENKINRIRERFEEELKNAKGPEYIEQIRVSFLGKKGQITELLKELKESDRFKDIPVIMATAKTSEFDKVIGLDSGADDYLAKPFGMMEMVSRIKAVLRRSQKEPADQIIRYGEIEIDKAKYSVRIGNDPIDLTPKEFELLLCLVENPGIVFSREQLLDKIWGLNYLGESRTIDVHINTLRNKLGSLGKYIITMHGIGYCLKEESNG